MDLAELNRTTRRDAKMRRRRHGMRVSGGSLRTVSLALAARAAATQAQAPAPAPEAGRADVREGR